MWSVLRYVVILIGAAIVVIGVAMVRAAGLPVVFETQPLRQEVLLRYGGKLQAAFTVEKEEVYNIQIELSSAGPMQKVNRLEEVTDRIDVGWQILKGASQVASGRSNRRSWFMAGDVTGKVLGDLRISPGTYLIATSFLFVPAELDDVPAQVVVVLNQNSLTDLGYTLELQPYVRNLGLELIVIGLLVIVSAGFTKSVARRLTRR